MDRFTHGLPGCDSVSEEMQFNEDENVWLLILPEIWAEYHFIPP